MYYTYALVKNTGNSYLQKKGRVGRKIRGFEDKVKIGALGILLVSARSRTCSAVIFGNPPLKFDNIGL